MPKHETLSNEEVGAVEEAARLEKLTFEAERLAKAAGLTVEQWLAQATREDREKYDHVPEVLASWERVDRECRERGAWMRRLFFDKASKASKDPVFTDEYLEDAEKRMKELGITLDELKAADYIFERCCRNREVKGESGTRGT